MIIVAAPLKAGLCDETSFARNYDAACGATLVPEVARFWGAISPSLEHFARGNLQCMIQTADVRDLAPSCK